MKKILYPSIVIFILFASTAFVVNMPNNSSDEVADNELLIVDEGVKWMSWKEMLVAQKTEKRKVIIDVYTDWCGWCKHMDKTTFKDVSVAASINKNLYAVKLDAESKEEYEFNGHTFKYVQQGRKGINELAYSLLDGKLSYPSIVYLNEEFARITISPGYKDNRAMLKEVTYITDEIYNSKTWEEYSNSK
jgi:thioredoxin-related protein